jgi:GntR family transcriptional regulator
VNYGSTDPEAWDQSRPIYRQLAERIIARIIGNTYLEGEMLPSVRQLSSEFEVNTLTVARAYRELAEFTESRRGIGLAVKQGARETLLERERERFLKEQWPSIRTVMQTLEIELDELP